MADLVLFSLGALTWALLRRKSEKANFNLQSLISPSSRLDFINAFEVLQTSQSPSLDFDWKRFWNLYTSETDLSDAEHAEMLRLRQHMKQTFAELELIEKKRAQEIARTVHLRLLELGVNEDLSVYQIRREDYRRGSIKEREYLRLHRNHLYRLYDNRCAKCGDDSNGLDIDHFFFSKNEGGCFQMVHRDGFILNNAIPLCLRCNRAKSDKHYKKFFSPAELLRPLELNAKMNQRLNKKNLNQKNNDRGTYVDEATHHEV